MDMITLTCPKCGARLSITSDIDRFVCASCGSEHIVRRGGGLVALMPVPEQVVGALKSVERSTDRTAEELKLRRLRDEMGDMQTQLEALAASVVRRDYDKVMRLVISAGRATPALVAARRSQTADYGELTRILLSLNETDLHTITANLRSGCLAPQASPSADEIDRIFYVRLQLNQHRAEMESVRARL